MSMTKTVVCILIYQEKEHSYSFDKTSIEKWIEAIFTIVKETILLQYDNKISGEDNMNILLINCSPVRNGATAEIIDKVMNYLADRNMVKTICIDDYHFSFCKGCKSCNKNAVCVHNDDIINIMKEFEKADTIISVAPSYWADIPGQFKAFIDRCTPWCNTHEPHATIGKGKTGYTIALRTGANEKECHRVADSIEHFYGHLEIKVKDRLCLCSVANKIDVEERTHEIAEFCNGII